MIECPIKSHFERSGQLHQLAGTFNIDRAIRSKHSQHCPTRAQQTHVLQILTHDIELCIRINKIPTTRTQQHMNR